ncbi:MAG TPA: nickel-dependent hydrogenase large subunit [Verrucomicrobia bacterium]|nr:MAG: cytochrome-c3 hydrogenase [Lentisphaerae bacterium GWF2_57_35]HBA84095.1 nickel-dependent hydrogenase large subunit [Verrucomicrobiota bacterium]
MEKSIAVSPLTRIEGHLAIHTETESMTSGEGKTAYRIKEARCEGEMFRGFEKILEGRDPLDAQQITQRICGVCSIEHGIASCRAQEMAYGIKIKGNGRLLQNLMLAAEYAHSHLLHFYHLSAVDFVDITAIVSYTGKDRALLSIKSWAEAALARAKAGTEAFPAAPFLPRYEGDYYIKDVDTNCALIAHYAEALDIRRVAHEMCAVFGARLPHSTALVPGGVTQRPTEERYLTYLSRLKHVQRFVEQVYLPDIVTAAQAFPQYWDVGGGYGNMLSYGVFENDDSGRTLFSPGALIGGKFEPLDVKAISEDVGHSRFASGSGLHPSQGKTLPEPRKANAYSWLKAPRYRGLPMEVGPLARVLVDYHSPNSVVKEEVDALLKVLGLPVGKLNSVLGRILARAVELRIILRQTFRWLDEVEMNANPTQDFAIPKSASGYGLTEAARGALGHWLTIDNYRIAQYQCVVPTTWNCSPRDDKGQPGPVEKALEGVVVADPEQPMEAARVVRSFDPCLACAVH